eukprot:TRINITY_DN14959_c0_g1_i1.p1 TRINITY_DN14959_c0_g1~~TRINITY_DN14959_c0_g1_i1.p1  ORF type:complete len:222 (-),score=27.79 TRINITY_DN14959_c0_g1_i1:85-750(-)
MPTIGSAGLPSGGNVRLGTAPAPRQPHAPFGQHDFPTPGRQAPRPFTVSHGAGMQAGKVYFGDRPMFDLSKLASASQVFEGGPILERTPSTRTSHSSVKTSTSSDRQSRADHWRSTMCSDVSNASQTFNIECHAQNFHDATLRAIKLNGSRLGSTREQRSTSSSSIDGMLSHKRSWGELYAGNIYHGSRSQPPCAPSSSTVAVWAARVNNAALPPAVSMGC